jgi:hypothetical protein
VIDYVKAGFNKSVTPAPRPTPTPIKDPAPTATLKSTTLKTAGVWQEFQVEYKHAGGVDIGSINSTDLRVKGNGWDLPVTLKSVTQTATGAIATYGVTTPGSHWDCWDNGNFTVYVQSGQVRSVRGTAVAAKAIGNFAVSIAKPVDPTPTVNNLGLPKVLSSWFYKDSKTQQLYFHFNQDVSNGLSLKDFDVFTSKGSRVAKYTMSLSYDKAKNVACITFKTTLRAGTYRANIWGGGVWNSSVTKNLDGNGDGKAGGNYATKFTV